MHEMKWNTFKQGPCNGAYISTKYKKCRLNRNTKFYEIIIFLLPLTCVTGYELLLPSGFPTGNSHLTTTFFTGIPSAPQVATTFSLSLAN